MEGEPRSEPDTGGRARQSEPPIARAAEPALRLTCVELPLPEFMQSPGAPTTWSRHTCVSPGVTRAAKDRPGAQWVCTQQERQLSSPSHYVPF